MRMNGWAMPVQIMVIKPLGYRLKVGGKLLYRQPSFLVCIAPTCPWTSSCRISCGVGILKSFPG